jgi:hypothetical protein
MQKSLCQWATRKKRVTPIEFYLGILTSNEISAWPHIGYNFGKDIGLVPETPSEKILKEKISTLTKSQPDLSHAQFFGLLLSGLGLPAPKLLPLFEQPLENGTSSTGST